MAAITKESLIGEILNQYPQTAGVFLEMGMHCLGCPASRGESVEEACAVHGLEADLILDKLNELAGN